MYPARFSVESDDYSYRGYIIKFNGIKIFYLGTLKQIEIFDIDEFVYGLIGSVFYTDGSSAYIMLKYSSEFMETLRLLYNSCTKEQE